jgi:cell division initiation protein
MEWTAHTIREVEFREKLRGYHPDDVDAFVEQVAAAFEKLETAGSPVGAPATEVRAEDAVSDETIRKTLLMAQRTADLVLSEAEESAAALLGDARTEAGALVAEANRLADDLQAEAHDRMAVQISELERTRAELQHDVDALHEYVERQRRRLRELLVEQLRVFDEGLTPLEAPPAPRPADDPQPHGGEEPVMPVIAAEAERVEAAPVETEHEHVEAEDRAVVDVDLLSRSVHLPAEGEDDPFLAELRRAIDDPSRAGPAQGDVDDEPQAVEDFEVRRSQTVKGVRSGDVSAYRAPGVEGNRLGGRLFRRR